jgi:hypothetical protein
LWYFASLKATLLLFCYFITDTDCRWLKTQAAADIAAANEEMYLQRQSVKKFSWVPQNNRGGQKNNIDHMKIALSLGLARYKNIAL